MKVFGVGFHKTGTTSLQLALERLGFSVRGHSPELVASLRSGELGPALELAARYDAVQDNPWPLLFADLDAAFPDAKFVLTTRPADEWLQSVLKHFGGTSTPMREWIYGEGDPRQAPHRYVERYRLHHEEVASHFADRPGKLLTVDWSSGSGWPELCPFLELPVPQSAFPHGNRARPQWVRTLRSKARRFKSDLRA